MIMYRVVRDVTWRSHWGKEPGQAQNYHMNQRLHSKVYTQEKWKYMSTHMLLLLLSRFSHVRLCVIPQTAAHQAPPSLGFSRQEHWSGLPFPSPMHEREKWKWIHSVMSNSSRPHWLQPTRLPHPWDFPGESTGVGCPCCLHSTRLQSLNCT